MVYIFLADGFEECEALIPIDILRRASVDIKTVGVTGKTVTGSHGISVICDVYKDEIAFDNSIEAVILPGGMPGTLNLKKDSVVTNFVTKAMDESVLVAAICAAPLILGSLGYLKGNKAVCYPGFENELTGAEISSDTVVRDGNIITAKGVGAAFDFGFEILNTLKHSPEEIEKLKQTMIYK